MVPTYKSGYELDNVWGGFCYHGKLPLKRIVGRFKNTQYKEICEIILWPWTTEVYGSMQNFILQEDNCGPHRAIAIRHYMEERGVTRMKWPAQSPDLNPIENVRGHMKTYFRKQPRHHINKEDCWNNVVKLWNDLPMSYFHNLIGSMASRIQEVLEKNGGSTKY